MGEHENAHEPRLESILLLPHEVLLYVVALLSRNGKDIGPSIFPDFLIDFNSFGIADDSLLALSSTCTLFREIIGPKVFSGLSLIRSNYIDALLVSPRSMQLFSDGHKLEADYFSRIRFDLGTRRFTGNSIDITGEPKPYTMNNFVSFLEWNNTILTLTGLSLFRNITCLKILDSACTHHVPETVSPTVKLEKLAVNALTLANSEWLLNQLCGLERLDMLLDFNETTPQDCKKITEQIGPERPLNLNCLNIFVTLPNALSLTPFLDFLCELIRYAPNLKSLSMRMVRSQVLEDEQILQRWTTTLIPQGNLISQFVDLRNISHVSFDEVILRSTLLHCPVPILPRSKNVTRALILTERTLGSQSPPTITKENVTLIALSLGINNLLLVYGEVLDQAHALALGYMSDLIHHINARAPDTISRATLQQCWSIAGDTITRNFYYDLIDKMGPEVCHETLELLRSSAFWSRLKHHSPRYRTLESYNVSNLKVHATRHHIDDHLILSQFWSGEGSLLDLEEYSVRLRPKSRLWR